MAKCGARRFGDLSSSVIAGTWLGFRLNLDRSSAQGTGQCWSQLFNIVELESERRSHGFREIFLELPRLDVDASVMARQVTGQIQAHSALLDTLYLHHSHVLLRHHVFAHAPKDFE